MYQEKRLNKNTEKSSQLAINLINHWGRGKYPEKKYNKKRLNHCRSSAISKVSMSAQAQVLVCSQFVCSTIFDSAHLTRTHPTSVICISWQFLASLRHKMIETIESFVCVSNVVEYIRISVLPLAMSGMVGQFHSRLIHLKLLLLCASP